MVCTLLRAAPEDPRDCVPRLPALHMLPAALHMGSAVMARDSSQAARSKELRGRFLLQGNVKFPSSFLQLKSHHFTSARSYLRN